jgi:hypothetical protein
MADEKNNEQVPALPPVAAPENAAIGDENIPAADGFQNIEVNDEAAVVPRTGPDYKVHGEVPVFEVHVQTDRVITDPNDPLAVQVPDAGRGDARLPIHAHVNARTVEEIFSEQASESADVSAEDRAKASADGVTPDAARGKSE